MKKLMKKLMKKQMCNLKKSYPIFGFLLVTTVVLNLFSCQPKETAKKQVSVADFGAVPDDGKNDAGPLRKAMEYCKSNPGATLLFPPGVYDFRDETAVELMEGILNGKVKGNPQDSIFKPYYPFAKGLDFDGVHDVTVEAVGAVLLFDGWGEPVSLSNCQNIRIKGLTIHHKVKPHIEGTITDVKPDWYEAVFDSVYSLTEKMPLCRVHYYDSKAHRLLSREDYFQKFEIIAPHTLKIYTKLDHTMKGNKIMVPHTFHFRPAVLMLEAKNIVLEDVTIHSQPGMGIVGHRSENILMTGLRIVPNAGQIMSSNTDATHFTSCKGYINYKNCQFEGHGDDAVNIHNYYLTIQKPADGKGYDLVLKGADWHAQVLDYPDVADTMELVSKLTLAVVKKYVAKTVENNIPELRSQVTFNEELPSDIENYYLINSTRLPKVEITGCTVSANRARGFLIKTRNVLIERNLVRESTGTGIHVGAEGSWHEGPASENITIRYNRILRCGTGAGTIDQACGIAVSVGADKADVPGLHKHILIEGNIIEGENAQNGIAVSGAKDVVVRYNEIAGCKIPVNIRYSTDVDVSSNPGVADWEEREVK